MAEKEAVEKRDSPSIEWVWWRGEWTSACCYTALPSLRSNCILGETLSLDLGESPRLRGLVCLRDLTGVLLTAFRCLLGFLNMVRWSFWSLVCSQHVWLNTPPDWAASADVAMRVICLLVVLFAMLLMLGVPKDLHGPHSDGHSVGLQRTHWCERSAASSGFRQSLHTWRHSHRRRDKCAHVLQSEYRNCRWEVSRK